MEILKERLSKTPIEISEEEKKYIYSDLKGDEAKTQKFIEFLQSVENEIDKTDALVESIEFLDEKYKSFFKKYIRKYPNAIDEVYKECVSLKKKISDKLDTFRKNDGERFIQSMKKVGEVASEKRIKNYKIKRNSIVIPFENNSDEVNSLLKKI